MKREFIKKQNWTLSKIIERIPHCPHPLPSPCGEGLRSFFDISTSLKKLFLVPTIRQRIFVFFSLIYFFLTQTPLCFSAPDPIDEFAKRVSSFTLKNGMQVLVMERHLSPTVSFATYIRTGGLDDEGGKSGLAHMFEHMLFKGTKTIGTKDYGKEEKILDEIDQVEMALQSTEDPNQIDALKKRQQQLTEEHESLLVPEEYWQLYEQAGAEDLNASTGFDFTNYVISLPINRIPLWMAMESDRIKNPVLREFYKERNVVMEERRMRVDSSASGKLWEQFLATAYMASPYGRPIIGWESEITHVTRADAIRFFARYYDVSRLVVAIVGDVKTSEIEKMMRQYFEPIASKGQFIPNRITTEPPQEGERRISVEYEAEPSLMIGYHRPNMNHPDEPIFSVLSDLLASGVTSRFHKEIVEKQGIATSVWADSNSPGEREPSLFIVGGVPRYPHTVPDLESAIYKEIERLKKDGPSEHELETVKNNTLADLLRPMTNNLVVANHLGYYQAVGGNWHQLIDLVHGIQHVTAADVQRVAQTYLTVSNRTVGFITKKSSPPLVGGGGGRGL